MVKAKKLMKNNRSFNMLENSKKTEDLSDLLAWIEKLPKTKGKKTFCSQEIDEILYGAPRKSKKLELRK